MLYLVIYKQAGIGCDYTIGCGINYKTIEAENEEELKEKIVYPEGKDEYSIFRNKDIGYEEIMYVPLENTTVLDINSIKKEIEEKSQKEAEEKERLEDEKEFERLRKKLGK